jgi:hypothetical protein
MEALQFTHDTIRMLGIHGLAVYMLLRCAEQEGIVPVSHQWIWDRMPGKTSSNTVTNELRRLTSPERQIAIRVKGGWRLNRENVFQLPLEYELSEGENLAERGNLPERGNYLNDVVVVESKGNLPTITTTTTTTRGENLAERGNHSRQGKNPLFDANLATLASLKIYGKKARVAADTDGATQEYIRAHVEWAREQSWIDNPDGFALTQIIDQVPAPENKQVKSNQKDSALRSKIDLLHARGRDDDE